jgi:hypothetical protein
MFLNAFFFILYSPRSDKELVEVPMRGEIFYLRKAINLLDTELGSVESSLLLSHRDALKLQLQAVSTFKFYGKFSLERISAGICCTPIVEFGVVRNFNLHSFGVCFKSRIMTAYFN